MFSLASVSLGVLYSKYFLLFATVIMRSPRKNVTDVKSRLVLDASACSINQSLVAVLSRWQTRPMGEQGHSTVLSLSLSLSQFLTVMKSDKQEAAASR